LEAIATIAAECGRQIENRKSKIKNNMNVPGLRSPNEKIGGFVYLPRLLDKIRLHAAGRLPQDYHANLGKGFDGAFAKFLRLDYAALAERVKKGGSDEEVLAWCFENGRKPDEDEIKIWSEFLRKRGWNDEASELLAKRKKESGFENRDDIQTFFSYIDADEGR
jgi:Domain of unknown function (DUF5069)